MRQLVAAVVQYGGNERARRVTVAAAAGVDAGVIADEPSTSSAATEEFGGARDQHASLTRHVTAVWNELRASRSLDDVDVQFQTTEYRDEMTMDSLIEGALHARSAALQRRL